MENLEQSKLLFEIDKAGYTLLDMIPCPIWRATPDGQWDFFNKSWIKLTGRAPAQEAGNGWKHHVHPEDLEICSRAHQSSFEAREPFKTEYHLKTPGENYIWLSVVGIPVYDLQGKFSGYIGFGLNITDAKRREEVETQKRKEVFDEVLRQIQEENKNIKEHLKTNTEKLLFPLIRKIKAESTAQNCLYIEQLEKNLSELGEAFGVKLMQTAQRLTPKEIEICGMIRNGLSTKEISPLLNVSHLTVSKHRLRIRRKLGLVNQDINLVSYLQNL